MTRYDISVYDIQFTVYLPSLVYIFSVYLIDLINTSNLEILEIWAVRCAVSDLDNGLMTLINN